jgi:hypothetical protein
MMMPDYTPRDNPRDNPAMKDRDRADQELAQEAERQRDRINHGCDGAHKPEEKFPIDEAEEAEDGETRDVRGA